jgi:release factor glutamine methyltransferase
LEEVSRTEGSVIGDKRYDIIVSNPPYIADSERTRMHPNVLEHEPQTALFVPDDDPLLFYRAIARLGHSVLKEEGWLYFEINPLFDSQLCEMLEVMGYTDVELKADEQGKQRMARACLKTAVGL